MEEPHTGLDDCPRMLLSCFRKRMSVLRVILPSILSFNPKIRYPESSTRSDSGSRIRKLFIQSRPIVVAVAAATHSGRRTPEGCHHSLLLGASMYDIHEIFGYFDQLCCSVKRQTCMCFSNLLIKCGPLLIHPPTQKEADDPSTLFSSKFERPILSHSWLFLYAAVHP